MTPFDIIIAILMVIILVGVDRCPLDRFVSALLLASVCVSHDLPVLRGWLAVIAFVAMIISSCRKPSVDQPATPAGPRMSAHELMGLYEDIAMAQRLRASTERTDHVRAGALMEMAIDQAAGPRRGL